MLHLSRLLRFAAGVCAALLVSLATPAQAADLTPQQHDAVTASAREYFQAVIRGDMEKLAAVTTPNFRVTTLEGQVLAPSQLAAKAKKVKFEYGNASTTGEVLQARTNGKTVEAIVWVRYSSRGIAPEGGPSPRGYTINMGHKLTWENTSNGWKLASDLIFPA